MKAPPEGARVVPGLPRLAASRDGRLWSLASGSWQPVDLDASGMRRFVGTLVRRTWPTKDDPFNWGASLLEGVRYTPTMRDG